MDTNIVIGRKSILELIDSGKQIEKIFLQTGTRGEFEKELRERLKTSSIPIQYVPVQKLNKMTSGNHQGVLAYLSLVEYQSVENVVAQLYEQGKTPFIVILDGVTDVRNFGAIARSAEVFGAHAIVSPLKNSAIINEITFKSSAGALSHITVCREKSLNNVVEALQNLGLQIIGADHHAEKRIDELDFTGPLAVVMGDEGEGISQHIRKKIDHTFKINQVGKTESLNVSVAAGVVFYEISKSRSYDT